MMALASSAMATTVIVPSDEDMIISSRAIVRGRVRALASAYDEQSGVVSTYVTLRIREVLKGSIEARRIVLKERGGIAGDHGTLIHGVPSFTEGEEVLLYLDTWPDGSLRVHQMFLGKFSVVTDGATGQSFVVRDDPGPHVEVLPQTEVAPAVNRMELGAYTEMVRNKLLENWSRAAEFESTHYGHVPLLRVPPEYEHKVSAGEVYPQFTLLNPSASPRWFEPDSGQPVVFFVKADGAPSPDVYADAGAAGAAWSNVPGSALEVASGGPTSACMPSPGHNTIVFDNCDRQFSPSSTCSGVLAVGGVWSYTTSVSRVIGGVTFFKALTGHVSVNPWASCRFTSQCRLQEVLTHEIGHAIGFGHSNDASATMYFQAHFDGRCASIRPDDASGVNFVYPAGSGGGGGGGGGGGSVSITTSSPLPTGTVGSSYSQTLSATGGTPPYSWSLVGGSLPSGLSLGSSGMISGTPSVVGTSSFTVRAADTTGLNSERNFSLSIEGSGPALESQFLSQSVPASVQSGQGFNVSMTWLNTGTAAWSEAAAVRIGSQNPQNNRVWGGNRITLPNGASIQPGEQLAVTLTLFAPSAPGTYNFQWQMVKEGSGFFGEMSSNVVITVSSVSVPTIGGASSLNAVRGTAFSHQLTATGGSPPYAWSVSSGLLPGGVGLNTSTGFISGTPTSAGVFSVTIQVTDSASQTAQTALTINVTQPPVEVVTSSLPIAVMGSNYTQQLLAAGGTSPYTWSVTGGTLPAGLSLNAGNGVISGAPSVSGNFSVTVTATDLGGSSGSRALTLTIVGPEDVPNVNRVRYKPGSGKLVIRGTNFSPTAIVLLNETAMPIKSFEPTVLVVKGVTLAPGNYTLRVMNPNGISSALVVLTVN